MRTRKKIVPSLLFFYFLKKIFFFSLEVDGISIFLHSDIKRCSQPIVKFSAQSWSFFHFIQESLFKFQLVLIMIFSLTKRAVLKEIHTCFVFFYHVRASFLKHWQKGLYKYLWPLEIRDPFLRLIYPQSMYRSRSASILDSFAHRTFPFPFSKILKRYP